MRIDILPSPEDLGAGAAQYAAFLIRQAIQNQGFARLALSTGASQFETLQSLVRQDIDWTRVEVFHLDEYVGIPADHPASFRLYLRERFLRHAPGATMHFVECEGDPANAIEELTRKIRKQPIDLALIGIGENGHIAFNDPPADFATTAAYVTVTLDDACKRQQVGEGWFATVGDVPSQAVSMTVHQIMQSRAILSAVPHRVKAQAVLRMLQSEITNTVPASILKSHPNFSLFLDRESASLFVK